MEQDDPFQAHEPLSSARSSALQIVSIALGAMSIPGALFLGLGIIPGIAGLICGIVAGSRARWGSGMAIVGILLSLAGTVFSGIFVVLIIWGFSQVSSIADEMAVAQFETSRAWEGVMAPELTLTDASGISYSLQDRSGQKLVIFQLFPMWGPYFDEAWVAALNRLAQDSSGEYEVIVLLPTVGINRRDVQKGFGINAPLSAIQTPPAPFFAYGMVSSYFVVDRNGVIQHVFEPDATYEELLEAARGPDYEGEVRAEPDLSGITSPVIFEAGRGSVLP